MVLAYRGGYASASTAFLSVQLHTGDSLSYLSGQISACGPGFSKSGTSLELRSSKSASALSLPPTFVFRVAASFASRTSTPQHSKYHKSLPTAAQVMSEPTSPPRKRAAIACDYCRRRSVPLVAVSHSATMQAVLSPTPESVDVMVLDQSALSARIPTMSVSTKTSMESSKTMLNYQASPSMDSNLHCAGMNCIQPCFNGWK